MRGTFALLVSLIFARSLSADTVILKNGNRIDGIVTGEDEKKIVLQFEEEATVEFSRSEVEKILYSSEEEENTLRTTWGRVEAEPPPSVTASAEIPDISISVAPPPSTPKGELLLSEGTWKTRKTQHFTVHSQEPSQGKAVANRAEYYLEKITDDLRIRKIHDTRKKYTVYVVKEESQWRRFLEKLGIQTELTGGFTTGAATGEIFLHAISIPYLQLAFPHELTHIILEELAQRRKIPLWFDEGFANYEGGIIGIDEELLMESLRDGKLISLKELVQAKAYPQDVENKKLFYTEAERFVEFLITQYGRRRFGEFTETLLKEGEFEAAFLSAYGGKVGTLEELEKLWLQYLSE